MKIMNSKWLLTLGLFALSAPSLVYSQTPTAVREYSNSEYREFTIESAESKVKLVAKVGYLQDCNTYSLTRSSLLEILPVGASRKDIKKASKRFLYQVGVTGTRMMCSWGTSKNAELESEPFEIPLRKSNYMDMWDATVLVPANIRLELSK
ncbi:MAG: hypothetical protein JNL01_12815 [Bdellovibrionales bacterium]|nr:hypothetical protein [Bdellovibrionales bacterium]